MGGKRKKGYNLPLIIFPYHLSCPFSSRLISHFPHQPKQKPFQHYESHTHTHINQLLFISLARFAYMFYFTKFMFCLHVLFNEIRFTDNFCFFYEFRFTDIFRFTNFFYGRVLFYEIFVTFCRFTPAPGTVKLTLCTSRGHVQGARQGRY